MAPRHDQFRSVYCDKETITCLKGMLYAQFDTPQAVTSPAYQTPLRGVQSEWPGTAARQAPAPALRGAHAQPADSEPPD